MIKTIWQPISKQLTFDDEVNEALSDGWKLLQRKIITPHTGSLYTILYAELEKQEESNER